MPAHHRDGGSYVIISMIFFTARSWLSFLKSHRLLAVKNALLNLLQATPINFMGGSFAYYLQVLFFTFLGCFFGFGNPARHFTPLILSNPTRIEHRRIAGEALLYCRYPPPHNCVSGDVGVSIILGSWAAPHANNEYESPPRFWHGHLYLLPPIFREVAPSLRFIYIVHM